MFVTDDVVRILSDLVALDSQNPPGREEEVVRYCETFLAERGFETREQPVAPGRSNLVATWTPSASNASDVPDGRYLAFSGHADTVPVGDEGTWTTPPLALHERDGHLYGRGACDMKGALAAYLTLADRVSHAHDLPRGATRVPFALLVTADEEAGFAGVKTLADHPVVPTIGGVVVGEPTRNQPANGHKGLAWIAVTFHGKAAHGSQPAEGVNAILAATRFLHALAARQEAWNHEHRHAQLGAPSLNVGRIAGGTKINVVPARCTVSLDFRLVPPLGVTDARQHVETILREQGRAVNQRSPGGVELEVDHEGLPFWVEPDADFFQLVARACVDPTPRSFPAFTEASVYQNELGIPTVLLGPGDIRQAHAVDEYVPRRALTRAVDTYARVLRAWGDRA